MFLPVATSFRRQMLFASEHPCYAGDLGIGPNPKLVARIKESDLILLIGGRLSEMPSQSYALLEIPAPRQQLVHVHPDAGELGKVYHPQFAINASPIGFSAALEMVQPPSKIVWADRTRNAHTEFLAWTDPAAVNPPSDAPIHSRLASTWRKNRRTADLIRRALVLHADQELNSSAFAARVAASTGASLAACVLSGFATLSGPLHGDATLRIRSLMEDVARTDARTVIAAHLASGMAIPGFGHPLYPEGDPRASALLAAFDPPRQFERMMETVRTATGQLPNLDFALLAMSQRCRLPQDAPFSLFALGRCVGWLAHAIDQAATGQLIRPRARYVGPALDNVSARQDFELAGSIAELAKRALASDFRTIDPRSTRIVLVEAGP